MQNKLKQLRGKAGLTQAEVASRIEVSQPTYQRWEAGNAKVPDNKLARLALALSTTVETLKGRYTPIECVAYSDKDDDEAGYWGEAAFHFRGGGKPLILSISDHAYSRLYLALQGSDTFVTVRSMANQTVVVRRGAVKDVYLSSDSYDYYGPRGVEYDRFHGIKIPDPREWAIIESMAYGIDDDGHAPEDVARVAEMVCVDEDRLKVLVANGHVPAEDFDRELARLRERMDVIFSLAREVVWQFSDGERRIEKPYLDEGFHQCARALVESDGFDDAPAMLRLRLDGGHRTIFLGTAGIDYLSLPTHAYEAALAEGAADELDEMAD